MGAETAPGNGVGLRAKPGTWLPGTTRVVGVQPCSPGIGERVEVVGFDGGVFYVVLWLARPQYF